MKNSVDGYQLKKFKEEVTSKIDSVNIEFEYDFSASEGNFKSSVFQFILNNVKKIIFINKQDGMRMIPSFVFPSLFLYQLGTPGSEYSEKDKLKSSEIPIAEYHNTRYDQSKKYTITTLQIIAVKVGIAILQLKWTKIQETLTF